ncbi:hypothetical protein DAMA08_040970 [Martiniozyma asiatica (nom. inval.)]|nr:hypothetical protein DAMA08_040970 [Martiniozyma asiatica]
MDDIKNDKSENGGNTESQSGKSLQTNVNETAETSSSQDLTIEQQNILQQFSKHTQEYGKRELEKEKQFYKTKSEDFDVHTKRTLESEEHDKNEDHKKKFVQNKILKPDSPIGKKDNITPKKTSINPESNSKNAYGNLEKPKNPEIDDATDNNEISAKFEHQICESNQENTTNQLDTKSNMHTQLGGSISQESQVQTEANIRPDHSENKTDGYFTKIITPEKSQLVKRFEEILEMGLDSNIILTESTPLHLWANGLHFIFCLLGMSEIMKEVFDSVDRHQYFGPIEDVDAEYIVKFLIKNTVELPAVRRQSFFLPAREQLANVISYSINNSNIQVDFNMLYIPTLSSGSHSSSIQPPILKPFIRVYMECIKYRRFLVLDDTHEFYDWFMMLKYNLEKMGLGLFLEDTVKAFSSSKSNAFKKMQSQEAELVIKQWISLTVQNISLKMHLPAQQLIGEIATKYGYGLSTQQVRSRCFCLQIKGDDFLTFREHYYYMMMRADVVGLALDKKHLLESILKRSPEKFYTTGMTFLKDSNGYFNIDEFIQHLENVNELAISVGAQFPSRNESVRKRKPSSKSQAINRVGGMPAIKKSNIKSKKSGKMKRVQMQKATIQSKGHLAAVQNENKVIQMPPTISPFIKSNKSLPKEPKRIHEQNISFLPYHKPQAQSYNASNSQLGNEQSNNVNGAA